MDHYLNLASKTNSAILTIIFFVTVEKSLLDHETNSAILTIIFFVTVEKSLLDQMMQMQAIIPLKFQNNGKEEAHTFSELETVGS